MDSKLGAYNIHDLRDRARRNLPKGVFEFATAYLRNDGVGAENEDKRRC